MKYILTFALVVLSSVAQARSYSEFRVGLAMGLSSTSVNDPAGDVSTESEFDPFYIISTYSLDRRDGRIWLGLQKQEVDFTPSTSKVGFESSRNLMELMYQHRFAFTESLSPWVGLGVGVSQAEYLGRHTVDSDGFNDLLYRDREETQYAVLLNASNEWELSYRFSMGLMGRWEAPIDGGFEGFFAGVNVFYTLD